MGAPIKFVRAYNLYGGDYYDVIYRSGRVVTVGVDDMPKTVRAFVENAKTVRHQYDSVYKRSETIYE